MHDNLTIREISNSNDPALTEVVRMFRAMYDEDRDGQSLELVAQGPELWLKGITRGLGRFNVVLVAEAGGKNIGFAHGNLRILPDYFGNHKVGFISNIYIEDSARKKGVGALLVRRLEAWFAGKKVHSVELDVLLSNPAGMAFWESMGYTAEMRRCRKNGSKL